MNETYWKQWYRKFKYRKPSDFAKFCVKRIPKGSTILDIGCGNMRDTLFFAKNKLKTIGVDIIDPGIELYKKNKYIYFHNFDAVDFIGSIPDNYFRCPVVYARFFLHAVERKKMVEFIAYCSAQNLSIYAEARSDRDTEIKKDRSHKRNLVNANALLKLLIHYGYRIEYFEEGKRLAKWKGEDPVIIRFIANG
ncbi:MAG: hypothetical protein COX19_10830 [Desulfobacterales bacterium CG23_combo_of_CG06-09_8_20_14_all_51_8]|nr:MAG: hypothetical protein COX19_10830 [Desulfobacterales bacterium CG23_combo_of_CG06-09_8_20_14_all_51_8]